jgi:ubiquinol-cytochrome c reductase cytochrome b subunit
VAVLTGPVLAFALTRTICHLVQARRDDEAKHGIETGRVIMTPDGGFTELREPVASRAAPGPS